MPNVLNESIYYNVLGYSQAFDRIRAFAVANGWTQDFYMANVGADSDERLVQLYSPGYVHQSMAYRLYEKDGGISYKGVLPGNRGILDLDDEHPESDETNAFSNCFGAPTISDASISLPDSTFTALYLYGSRKFISAVFHLTAQAVVTLCFGTYDLFKSWQYYPGLWYTLYPCKDFDDWTGIESSTKWQHPLATRRTAHNIIIYDGSARDYTRYQLNYAPAYNTSIGAETGAFNVPRGLLRYNLFTSKRVAFQSTYFIKDPTLEVWYPIGLSPFAWVNGYNLEIGETVYFGSDQYRCFPGVFSTNLIWQAYRIS